jgi:hypothetical protein
MISLREWAKLQSIPYSAAKKLFHQNKIDGAIQSETKRVMVPEDASAIVETVACAVCQREFTQISAKHLDTHSLTVESYRQQFPKSPLLPSEKEQILDETLIDRTELREKIQDLINRVGAFSYGKSLRSSNIDLYPTLR